MMDYLAGIPGLGRYPLDQLLETLNHLRLKSKTLDASARPLLALHLHGGTVIEGWLLDFGNPEKGKDPERVVVLHRSWPNPQQPAEAVAFIPLREIQSITVFEAPAAARHLLPPMTKMDLRRLADTLGQEWGQRLNKTLTTRCSIEDLPESDLAALANQLHQLKASFESIASEPLGQSALKEKISGLEIKTGSSAVNLSGGTLSLTLSPSQKTTVDSLKKAIEDVL